MTPEQVRLIRESWNSVAAIADSAVEQFYNRLFEIDPTTRALFRATNMPEQRKKVAQALSLAVQGADNLAALTPVLQHLGRSHHGYGVTTEQYKSVGAALLWTLEQGLGPQWTPATATAWTELYGRISAVMLRAADEMPRDRAA
jgi:hemoglobin-like flavoprotein